MDTVECRGTGISLTIAEATARRQSAHCIVMIPRKKLSGLCHFCERTEKGR